MNRQPEQEPPTGFGLALAEAERIAGGMLVDLLQQYGDPNPLVGMRTILVALVEAGVPKERLCDLAYLGRNRLRRFQLRGGHIQTTVPGYFINLMRNLASEARDKGWETERIEREDQVKHQDILRRLAVRGQAQSNKQAVEAETEPEAAEEEASASSAARSESLQSASAEEPLPVASAPPEAEPLFAPDPAQFLPEGVEVANAATVATWQDHLPDPQGGQPRSVSMLWGFVREEIRGQLNTARRQHLDGLIPKWDASRPRTLLLVCRLTYTARAFALTLRRELEPPFDKLLSHFFDEMQVVYAPGCEQADGVEEV